MSLRVNVIVKPGWILQRLAQELVERIPGVTLNAGRGERAIDPAADVQYYLPAKDFRKYPTRGAAIGFYTHGDNGFDLIDRFAACVTMNQAMAARVTAAGAAAVTVIRPGTEPPPRPIVFGVIGRCYHDGRKGEHLVAQAVAEGFSFVACHLPAGRRTPRALTRQQWPCPHSYTIAQRDAFYAAIDYLVVTSTEEGGPMPVLEAVARGVPVIAPNVGWSWEFPTIRYAVGDWASLRSVLQALTQPPTWDAWAEGHRALFATLATAAGKVA